MIIGRVFGISGSVPEREGAGEKTGEGFCKRKDKTGEAGTGCNSFKEIQDEGTGMCEVNRELQ